MRHHTSILLLAWPLLAACGLSTQTPSASDLSLAKAARVSAPVAPVVEAPPSPEQAAQFRHFTINEGLAANQTYCVLQGQEGFLWIATRQGLSRFDGSDFVNFAHDPDNPNSLSSSYIWSMRQTPDGALWLSLWGGGLDRFDPSTGIATHFRAEKDNPNSLSTDFINASLEDSRGNIWVAADKYLDKLDPATRRVKHYQPDPKNPNSLGAPVYTLLEDSSGVLWLGTYQGLDRFDPVTETFTHYRHEENNPDSLSGGYVWSLLLDRSGILWVGTEGGGLNRFDPATGKFRHFQHKDGDASSLSNNTVTFLGTDRQGAFWVGTLGGGVSQFDPQSGRFRNYQYDKFNPESLSNNTVWSVIEDEAGAHWIATESGLNQYDPAGHRFQLYRSDPANPNSLSSNFIMAFYEDTQGVIWIGTMGGGLDRFDRTKGTFTHFQNDPKKPSSLGHNDVNRIVPGRNGVLWLGTSGGLDRFDPKSGTFVHFRHDAANPNSLLTNNVQGLIRDPEGKLWVSGYNGGISYFDPETGKFTHFVHDDKNPESLASNSAYDFLVASDGALWVACHGGLSRLPQGSHAFTNFTPEKNHLSDAVVENVYEDSRGTIWVSTDNGLNRFDPTTQMFTTYSTKNGLPSNHVSGLVEDGKGALWIATYRGVSRFDPQAGSFRNFDQRDGLQDYQFSQAVYKTRSGELFMGGVNGFNAFYPDRLTDNPYIPKVVLTDFQLLNRPVRPGAGSPLASDISVATSVTLPYNYTVLTLKFTALSFRSPEKNRYAFMMSGFDQDWTYTDSTNRLATYTNLNPGDYLFRVKASNNDGVWNEQGTALRITVTPPWWGTWWFRLLAAAAMVGLAWGIHLWRVRNLRVRGRELEVQVAERTAQLAAANSELQAFAYSVSHDLRAPLRAISGFSAILARRHRDHLDEEGRHYVDNIVQAGERMGHLIEDLLTYSRLGHSSVPASPVSLGELLKSLAEEFTVRLQESGAILEIEPNAPSVMGDKSLLTAIFTNLIDNALTYRRSGVEPRITITHLREGTNVIVKVSDNGIGIPAEHHDKIFNLFQRLHNEEEYPGTGIGLSTVKKSADLLGGRVWVESEVGQGSTFFVQLQLATATAPTA